MDGTGWSVRLYERWLDHRVESESTRHGWVKLHLVSGVSTNVVARAVVSPSSHHDSPYFRGLAAKTAQHFDVRRMMADMAYSGRLNHQLARDLGFALFVPFKSNTVTPDEDGSAWSEAWQVFDLLPAFFYEAYHKRSNVEATNSSLKRLFPAELRCEEFEGACQRTSLQADRLQSGGLRAGDEDAGDCAGLSLGGPSSRGCAQGYGRSPYPAGGLVGSVPSIIRAGFGFIGFLFDYSCKAPVRNGFLLRKSCDGLRTNAIRGLEDE